MLFGLVDFPTEFKNAFRNVLSSMFLLILNHCIIQSFVTAIDLRHWAYRHRLVGFYLPKVPARLFTKWPSAIGSMCLSTVFVKLQMNFIYRIYKKRLFTKLSSSITRAKSMFRLPNTRLSLKSKVCKKYAPDYLFAVLSSSRPVTFARWVILVSMGSLVCVDHQPWSKPIYYLSLYTSL